MVRWRTLFHISFIVIFVFFVLNFRIHLSKSSDKKSGINENYLLLPYTSRNDKNEEIEGENNNVNYVDNDRNDEITFRRISVEKLIFDAMKKVGNGKYENENYFQEIAMRSLSIFPEKYFREYDFNKNSIDSVFSAKTEMINKRKRKNDNGEQSQQNKDIEKQINKNKNKNKIKGYYNNSNHHNDNNDNNNNNNNDNNNNDNNNDNNDNNNHNNYNHSNYDNDSNSNNKNRFNIDHSVTERGYSEIFGREDENFILPSLLCLSFSPLTETSIPAVIKKIFAFNVNDKNNNESSNHNNNNNDSNNYNGNNNNKNNNNTNNNDNENHNNNNNNDDINNNNDNNNINNKNGYCDWFLVFYSGDKYLMQNLKQKIRKIETKNNLSHYSENDTENDFITENSENRYKGKVVKIIYADRENTRKSNSKFQKRYYETAKKIQKKSNFSFLSRSSEKQNSKYFEIFSEKNLTDEIRIFDKSENKTEKDEKNSLILSKLFLFLPLLNDAENIENNTNNEDYQMNDNSTIITGKKPIFVFDIFSYSHIWLIDDDLDLTDFDLNTYLRVRSSAKFSLPVPVSYFSNFSYFSSFFPSFIHNVFFKNKNEKNDSRGNHIRNNYNNYDDNNNDDNNSNNNNKNEKNNHANDEKKILKNRLENSFSSFLLSLDSSPLLSQPLIAENTQSYKFLNWNTWNKKKSSLRQNIKNHYSNNNNNNNNNDNNNDNSNNNDNNNINNNYNYNRNNNNNNHNNNNNRNNNYNNNNDNSNNNNNNNNINNNNEKDKSDNDNSESNRNYNNDNVNNYRKDNLIASETKFIEIQTPIIEIHFFVWFIEFFVIPLLGVSEILGTDWGLDSLFCEAARFYRNEEMKYRLKVLSKVIVTERNNRKEIKTDINSNYINMKNDHYDNDYNNYYYNIDDNNYKNDNMNIKNMINEYNKKNVVCAVIISGTPVHHKNEKILDEKLGKINKKLLNIAMIKIIKKTFPFFYLDGHEKRFNPLNVNTDLRKAYG